VEDANHADLISHFASTIEFIENAINNQCKVLIHWFEKEKEFVIFRD
jgi:predicted transcriptional regulator YheO